MRNLLLFIVLAFTGCHTAIVKETNFVVHRDVPQNPSFVVIPSNYSNQEIEFANEIEELLLSYGISILARPTIKEVTTHKGAIAGKSEISSDDISGASESIAERFYSLGEIESEYILYANLGDKRIKIIHAATREILSSFRFSTVKKYLNSPPRPSQMDKLFRDAITTIGIDIKNKKEDQ